MTGWMPISMLTGLREARRKAHESLEVYAAVGVQRVGDRARVVVATCPCGKVATVSTGAVDVGGDDVVLVMCGGCYVEETMLLTGKGATRG